MKGFISYYKANLKVMIQYRWALIVSVFIDPLVVLINISLFTSIYHYNKTSAIAGYSLSQMIWYFAGINFVWYFTMNFADLSISQGILTGDLSMILLKPVSIFGVELGHAAALRTMGVLFEFLPSLILYSVMCTPDFMTAGSLGRFLISIILSFILMFLISFLVGLTAFFIKNNLSMRNLKFIFIGLLGGAYFPIDFYPECIRNILYYLPFKYVFYIPLQILLNMPGTRTADEYLRIISIQSIWIIVLFILCKVLWHKSIRRFCAVGG